jgi:hypothetical protein
MQKLIDTKIQSVQYPTEKLFIDPIYPGNPKPKIQYQSTSYFFNPNPKEKPVYNPIPENPVLTQQSYRKLKPGSPISKSEKLKPQSEDS